METQTTASRSLGPFFLLVFAMSIPFWVAGFLPQPKGIPIDLPISVLMLVCPITAASILVYRKDKFVGVQKLLLRAFDYKRIGHKAWYIPVIFFMPAVMVLSYGVMRLAGLPLPEPHIPLQMALVLFPTFFIGAIGEEIGWSGYVIEPLQQRWGALRASIMLGAVWAVWHLIPFTQTQHTATWIFWQCMTVVGLRVIMVWLYNNIGRSVFAMILAHAMFNVSEFLFPNYGSHYDPFIAGSVIAFTAVIVTLIWGPKTLARFRYAQ